jgi:hypothetical protein
MGEEIGNDEVGRFDDLRTEIDAALVSGEGAAGQPREAEA